jgi:hypothetical protein
MVASPLNCLVQAAKRGCRGLIGRDQFGYRSRNEEQSSTLPMVPSLPVQRER